MDGFAYWECYCSPLCFSSSSWFFEKEMSFSLLPPSRRHRDALELWVLTGDGACTHRLSVRLLCPHEQEGAVQSEAGV